MIEGGIHSREWISPATVTWIIKEFLTSTNTDVRNLAETFVWHIFPVVNPDGYVYTFSDVSILVLMLITQKRFLIEILYFCYQDRMWRKNRNTVNYVNCTNVANDLSNGIDLNRNFNFLWMSKYFFCVTKRLT